MVGPEQGGGGVRGDGRKGWSLGREGTEPQDEMATRAGQRSWRRSQREAGPEQGESGAKER